MLLQRKLVVPEWSAILALLSMIELSGEFVADQPLSDFGSGESQV
jgi:hypothetical protein